MQVGFRCPRGDVSYETCRECRQDPLHPCGIPAPLLEHLERKSGEDDLSTAYTPSRLLGCYRIPVLAGTNDYYLNVQHAYASLRGELIHSGLEQMPWHAGYETIREMRLSTWVDTATGPQLFQAKPDMIVVHVVGEDDAFPDYLEVDIWDWKTREFDKGMTEAELNHIRQVWMYAYIISRTASQWWSKTGGELPVRVRSVNICYISSSSTRIFSSLGTGVAYNNRGRGKTAYVEELALSPIPTYTLSRVEKFVREKIEAKARSLTVLPPALEGEAAKWCYRCPLLAACRRAGPGEVVLKEAA